MIQKENERGQQEVSFQSPEVAGRYAQQMKESRNLFGEVTQRMVDAAALREGFHVLDIAAGTGEQSLLAAQNVGRTGRVLATDISAEMLKMAAQMAEQEGFTTITTRVMNAEQLDLADETFDAVICRMGLMLVDHQKALREIVRVLKPQRKLAALVWSTPDRHPAFSMPLALAAKYLAEPAPVSNVFSLGEAGVFEQALKLAGFHDVSVQSVSIQFSFPSWEALLHLNPMMPNVVKRLNPQAQERWREEVKQAAGQFEGANGLSIPAELLLGVGTK